MKRLKVGFVSLGCPKNLVDTESMISALAEQKLLVTGDQNEADIVVINTCGFLEPAKQESMDTIGEFIDKKKAGKLEAVVVAGCMTERYLKPMQEAYPDVNAFIRTGEFSKIAEVVQKIQAAEGRVELHGDEAQLSGHSEIKDFVKRLPVQRPYAYVKISEGCNRVCSFCIIPKLRGKHHSRSIPGVVDEIQQLVDYGTQEVAFIAQDLTSYGRDLSDGTSLLSLLKEVESVEGLYWYRLMYNYPRFFTDELIEFLSTSEKFSGYIDIPFQHAADGILRAMKRPESNQEIRTLIEKFRSRLPRLSLRTTLMVGFPGETEEDFEQLLEFVKEAEFDHMGAFTFYREQNTASYDLPNQVLEEMKQERYARLMELQKQIHKKKLKQQIGEETEAIVDGFDRIAPTGWVYRGRTWRQAPEIDGMTYIYTPEKLEPGDILAVEIEEGIGDYDLKCSAVVDEDVQLEL